MAKRILQRIILCLLYILPLFAVNFPCFLSLAIVDTFTGGHENILLEPGKITNDDKHRFEIKVKSIETDTENPNIAWVDLEIRYIASKVDAPVCIQRGKLCTNQIYRFNEGRYILGFDVSSYLKEDSYLEKN